MGQQERDVGKLVCPGQEINRQAEWVAAMDQHHRIVACGQFKHRRPMFPDRVLVFLRVELDPHALLLPKHPRRLLKSPRHVRVDDHPLQQALGAGGRGGRLLVRGHRVRTAARH